MVCCRGNVVESVCTGSLRVKLIIRPVSLGAGFRGGSKRNLTPGKCLVKLLAWCIRVLAAAFANRKQGRTVSCRIFRRTRRTIRALRPGGMV